HTIHLRSVGWSSLFVQSSAQSSQNVVLIRKSLLAIGRFFTHVARLLQRIAVSSTMSALGQKRTFCDARAMFALPPKAVIRG
ncbi:MAG: hypothetical protein WBZ23_22630, partial [Pseudolabrys sp.]